jgi:hypothetical protein
MKFLKARKNLLVLIKDYTKIVIKTEEQYYENKRNENDLIVNQ